MKEGSRIVIPEGSNYVHVGLNINSGFFICSLIFIIVCTFLTSFLVHVFRRW